MKMALAIALLVFVNRPGMAEDQKIEYGDVSELRGVKVVFIDSGLNLKFRENAIEALKKELPGVRVGLEDDADVVLQVAIRGSDSKHGEAVMLVLGRTTKPNTVHVIARYEDSKSSVFTKKLSSVLIGRFARDYRDANR